jgi:hypothetical protein
MDDGASKDVRKAIVSALVLLASACSESLGPAPCLDYRRNNEPVDCKELEKPLDGGADAADAAKDGGDGGDTQDSGDASAGG